MTNMSATQLLGWINERFPEFEAQWCSGHNYFVNDDGSFTHHGVCAEFSDYYQAKYRSLSQASVVALFDLTEECLRADPDDKTKIGNALATCFLENIASTPSGSDALQYMGVTSKAFFKYWHSESEAKT